MAKLYLENKMSAKEVIGLVQKAYRAGIHAVGPMARAGGAQGHWSNAARNLMSVLLKDLDFPAIYWAQIPCHGPSTSTNRVQQWVPFLLPHEVLHRLVEKEPNIVEPAAHGTRRTPSNNHWLLSVRKESYL